MILIVVFSSILAITILLLLQAIGTNYLLESLDYILLFLISLIIVILSLLVLQEKIWDKLTSFIKPKTDEVSVYLSQQLTVLRDAVLKADSNQVQVVSHNIGSKFSEWYQKYLFRRFLVKSIIGLIVTTAGLTTLVLWKKQNFILKGHLSAVSEQVALQRQQWFLNQRTNLMSILYDRKPCPKELCSHLANLRTRTQAAITLIQMGKTEVHSMEANQKNGKKLSVIQPESLLNLSYVDLSDSNQSRQRTPGHGSYLANLDWSLVTLLFAKLDHSSLAHSNLSSAKMQYVSLVNTNIMNTSFVGAFLMGADLSKSFGDNTDFRNADLSSVNLSEASIRNAKFSGANLSGTIFHGSNITGANFNGALGISCSQLSSSKDRTGIILPEGMSCN